MAERVPHSTWWARAFGALIIGLITALVVTIALVLPAMLLAWLIFGPLPPAAWRWVGGVVAAAALGNALRFAFRKRSAEPSGD